MRTLLSYTFPSSVTIIQKHVDHVLISYLSSLQPEVKVSEFGSYDAKIRLNPKCSSACQYPVLCQKLV